MAKHKSFDLSRLNVLIVDDNKHMQLMLKEILRAFHIRTFQTADDGADGLKILRTFPADIIICDWNMRPLDGLEFVELVRQSNDSANPYVSIIMLTGHTEYQRIVEARDTGINEFLAKPVSPSALYNRVVRCIVDPRRFIKTKHYFGPDRRRKTHIGARPYDGPERRKSDSNAEGVASASKLADKEMSQEEIEALMNS